MFSANRLFNVLNQGPSAYANMIGSDAYPSLSGRVTFYPADNGILVMARVWGLPSKGETCPAEVFGFHIHEGTTCTGTTENPFADVGPHFNPYDCPHPSHAGDLPPLFGNSGYAFMIVFTDRFTIQEIMDRTVIIHLNPDDFTTQPSGNSGPKIACGVIRRGRGF